MTQSQDFALLNDLLDGRLAPAEAEAIRRRIADESDLAAAWEDLNRLRAGLRALPGPAVPEGFVAAVRARIARVTQDEETPAPAAAAPGTAGGASSTPGADRTDRGEGGEGADRDEATTPGAPVIPMQRRGIPQAWFYAAAAVLGIAVGAGAWMASRDTLDPGTGGSSTVQARDPSFVEDLDNAEIGDATGAAKPSDALAAGELKDKEASREARKALSEEDRESRVGTPADPRAGDEKAAGVQGEPGSSPSRPGAFQGPGGAVPPSLRQPSDAPPPSAPAGRPAGASGPAPTPTTVPTPPAGGQPVTPTSPVPPPSPTPAPPGTLPPPGPSLPPPEPEAAPDVADDARRRVGESRGGGGGAAAGRARRDEESAKHAVKLAASAFVGADDVLVITASAIDEARADLSLLLYATDSASGYVLGRRAPDAAGASSALEIPKADGAAGADLAKDRFRSRAGLRRLERAQALPADLLGSFLLPVTPEQEARLRAAVAISERLDRATEFAAKAESKPDSSAGASAGKGAPSAAPSAAPPPTTTPPTTPPTTQPTTPPAPDAAGGETQPAMEEEAPSDPSRPSSGASGTTEGSRPTGAPTSAPIATRRVRVLVVRR